MATKGGATGDMIRGRSQTMRSNIKENSKDEKRVSVKVGGVSGTKRISKVTVRKVPPLGEGEEKKIQKRETISLDTKFLDPGLDNSQSTPNPTPREMGSQLFEYDPKKNKEFRKAIALLKKPNDKRMGKDLDFLDEALGGKKIFDGLSKDPTKPINLTDELVRKCWKAFHYRRYEADKELITFGEVGEEFYILLRGIVEIKVPLTDDLPLTRGEVLELQNEPKNVIFSIQEKHLDRTNKDDLNIINELKKVSKRLYTVKRLKAVVQLHDGAAFGELALINNKPRAATITSIEPCHVAYLNRSDFRVILGQILKKEQLEKVKVLAKFPILNTQGGGIMLKLQYKIKLLEYTKGEIVYHEGDLADKLYFIEDGEFQLSKYVYTQKKKNGMTEVYAIMNEDNNRRYQMEYEDPNDLENQNLYEGLLPKKKRLSRQSVKVFGVVDLLSGVSKRILTVKCASEKALVHCISIADFNYIIKRYDAMESIQSSILNRVQFVEERLSEIFLSKKHLCKLFYKTEDDQNTQKGYLLGRGSKEVDRGREEKPAVDLYDEGGYEGIEGVPHFASNTPVEVSVEESSQECSRLQKYLSEEGHTGTQGNSPLRRGKQTQTWDHLLSNKRELLRTERMRLPELVRDPSFPHQFPMSPNEGNYEEYSGGNNTAFFKRYARMLNEMKKEDMFFITQLQDGLPLYPARPSRLKNSHSHIDLPGIRGNKQDLPSGPNMRYYGKSEHINRHGSVPHINHLAHTAKPYPTLRISPIKSIDPKPKLVSTKHNLFRLVNLHKFQL